MQEEELRYDFFWKVRDGSQYRNRWIFGKVQNGLWPPPPPWFSKNYIASMNVEAVQISHLLKGRCKSEEDITSFQRKVMQISPFWMQSNADITPSQLDLGVGFRCHICFCTPVHLNCIWMLSQSQLHDYLMSPLSFGAYSDASITFLVILLLQFPGIFHIQDHHCNTHYFRLLWNRG